MEDELQEESSGRGIVIGAVILAIIVAGAAWYFFIIREPDGETALDGQTVAEGLPTAPDETASGLEPFSETLQNGQAEDMARLTGSDYLALEKEEDAEEVLKKAFKTAEDGKPVLVEVKIDYSRKTYFTKGVVKTNFWRLPMTERLRMVTRVVARKLGA